MKNRQRDRGPVGPETIGERHQIKADILKATKSPERHVRKEGGTGDTDSSARLGHLPFHPGDVWAAFQQRRGDGPRERETRHAKIVC